MSSVVTGWIEAAGRAAVGYGSEAMALVSPFGIELLLAAVTLLAAAAYRSGRRLAVTQAQLRAEVAALELAVIRLERVRDADEQRRRALEQQFETLARRQSELKARDGRVDYRLAASMTRGGANERQLVDCGLSHAEAHLLGAVHGAQRQSTSP